MAASRGARHPCVLPKWGVPVYPFAMTTDIERFVAAPFIKEIGRGVKGARSMSRDDAHRLYAAMLEGRVSDLELGAILLAMRIKGESVDELAGFMDAASAAFDAIARAARRIRAGIDSHL